MIVKTWMQKGLYYVLPIDGPGGHKLTAVTGVCTCRCVKEVSPEELTAWLATKLPELEQVLAGEVTLGPKACSIQAAVQFV